MADIIRTLEKRRRVLAMVAENLNDAPALPTGRCGACNGSGTDVGCEGADVVLIGEISPYWSAWDYRKHRAQDEPGSALQYPAKSSVRMSSSSTPAPISILLMPATMAGGPAL